MQPKCARILLLTCGKSIEAKAAQDRADQWRRLKEPGRCAAEHADLRILNPFLLPSQDDKERELFAQIRKREDAEREVWQCVAESGVQGLGCRARLAGSKQVSFLRQSAWLAERTARETGPRAFSREAPLCFMSMQPTHRYTIMHLYALSAFGNGPSALRLVSGTLP